MKLKLFLKRFKNPASLLISVSLLTALILVSTEWASVFFNKLTFFSAAAAMPQGAVGLVKNNIISKTSSEDKEKEQEQNVQKEENAKETKQQISEKDTAETSSAVKIPENAGKISEYSINASKKSSKVIWYDNAAFLNSSKTSNSEILKILKQAPVIKKTGGKPQVLIYHTHTTESYEMEDLGYYKNGSNARTTDERYNMVKVGDEITRQLEKAGIVVIHDRKTYDYPSYSGAYYRSADTVRSYLKKYPTITITLDIHRDAIQQSNGTRVKPTAVINGKKAAQVMIIAGVDDGTMNFPDWRENMKFASCLQRKMENGFPGLTRSVMVCHRRYNMYLTKNSLLIEVGGHANTLNEAVYSGEMIGKSLAKVIKENEK